MTELLRLLARIFLTFIGYIDSFKLVGSLSLLDFIIIVAALDIVISAVFVTFNVRVGPDGKSFDTRGGSDGS